MCIFERYFFFAALALCFSACGVVSPKFEDYEDDAALSGPADASTACGAEALALFEANIQTGIASTCATAACHAGGSASKELLLSASDTEANRLALFNYTSLQREKLTTFISNPAQHPGGDQSAVLPLDKVGPWVDKEVACAAGT